MLDEKIRELIGKNLPELAAGKLKDFIEEAEETKKELKRYKENSVETGKLLAKVIEERDVCKGREKSIYELAEETEKREIAVGDYEHKLQLSDMKLICADGKVELLREFTGLVFRNTIVRKNVLKSSTIKVEDGHDCQGNDLGSHVEPVSDTEDTTKTEE